MFGYLLTISSLSSIFIFYLSFKTFYIKELI